MDLDVVYRDECAKTGGGRRSVSRREDVLNITGGWFAELAGPRLCG